MALQKYKVLQKLEEQWEGATSGSARDELVRQETMALRDAVFALRKLNSAESARKLEDFRHWLEGCMGEGGRKTISRSCSNHLQMTPA